MKPIIRKSPILATTLMLLPVTTHAAVISWGSATNVATTTGNSTDVSTNGTLVEAFNGVAADQFAAATNVTVNGVTFTPTTSLLSGSLNAGAAQFSSNTVSGDPTYNTLLNTLEFGGGTNLVTLTLGDGDGDTSTNATGLLTIGTVYEIQVWYSDTRPAQIGRTTPVGDGNGNTVDLSAEGQFAIGTFTADAATQDITLASPGFGQAHINAYQIRDLTAVIPEPSSALLSGLAALALLRRRRD